MAKFAPVAPIQVVSKMHPGASQDYHLLLAHDVAEHSDAYRKFFGLQKNTVIMDNSVIELGNAVDLKVIKKALLAVDCATVVLPDVLLDAQATKEACSAAIPLWADALSDVGFGQTSNNGRRGFMIVPQGNTLAEWADCARHFAHDPMINFWGIPRNLVAKIGTRRDAIDIAYQLNSHRRIHLLGFSDDVCDDVLCASDRRVEGIDSAVPIRCGTLGIEFSFNSVVPPRDPNWFDTAEWCQLMDDNTNNYRNWIRRT